MRILDFTSITEEQGKTAVFAFGRMNPPTIGHKKLADAVCDEAIHAYCKKFDLGTPKNIFKDEDRGLLVNKLFGEEMKMIKDGQYSCY